LRTLFVVPEHWRTGVGSALHDRGLERLKDGGCSEARLWTLTENLQAQLFYEHRGWTATGATRVTPFPPRYFDLMRTIVERHGGAVERLLAAGVPSTTAFRSARPMSRRGSRTNRS